MRRALAVLLALALVLFLVPAAGAVSGSPRHAATWEQTDTMGAWIELDSRSKCIDDSWIQSHITFFRGGTDNKLMEDPFDNAGEFEAIENGTTTHTGKIWWIASGRTKLISFNPVDPCDLAAEFPVKGEFHGKGEMKITESVGDVDREGTVCSVSWAIHLTGVPNPFPPIVTWGGNFVADCDDGAKIHLQILGPTGEAGLEDQGIQQHSEGIILDK